MIAAVAAASLRIPLAETLEVRARQVVEQDVEGLIEQRPDPRLQVRLERRLVRQQPIQRTVQPILVHLLFADPADVLERGPGVEAFLDRKLRRRRDQTCRGQDERHQRPRDPLAAPLHPCLEQLVQSQELPQVPRQKDLAEVPRPLPAHSPEQHLHHTLAARHHRRVARKQLQLALAAFPVEHRDRLAPRRLHRPVQFPEVRKRPVLRASRRAHRLHQRVVAVILAVLDSVVDLQKHAAQDCPRPES